MEVRNADAGLSAQNFHKVLVRRANDPSEALRAVLDVMRSMPPTLAAFKLDFMTYTLRAAPGTEAFCLAVYEHLMRREGDRLQVEAWRNADDVLALFTFRHLAPDPSFAALAGQYAAPLTRLRPDWLRDAVSAQVALVAAPGEALAPLEFSQRVATLVLTQLLRQLAAAPGDERAAREADMQRWCEAAMELRSYARWWPLSAATHAAVFLPGLQYAVLLAFLLVVIHRRLLPAKALDLLCAHWPAMSALYGRVPIGIPDLVRLAHTLCEGDNKAKRTVTAELLANLLPLALVPAARPAYTEDLRSFAELCCDAPGPLAAALQPLRVSAEGDVLLPQETVLWLWAMIWRKAPVGMADNIVAIAADVIRRLCPHASEHYEARMNLLPADACDGLEAPAQPVSMLEKAVLLCRLHHTPPPAERAALLDEFLALDRNVRTVASRLHRAALAAAALRAAAQDLSAANCDMARDEWIARLGPLLARADVPARELSAPLNALETLVSSLQPDVALRFLKEALPRLALPPAQKQAWTVVGAAELSQRIFAVFRFQLPASTHPLAPAYQAVVAALRRDPPALLQFIRDQCATDADRYRTRMLVALGAYYEFADKGEPCAALMALLQDPATLTGSLVPPAPAAGEAWRRLIPDMELNAFRLLAMGPAAATQHLFGPDATAEARKADVLADSFCHAATKRTVLVNTLAVALGCPPPLNHVYACAFYAAAAGAASPAGFLPVNSKAAPGSVQHRLYYDCGFKMPFPDEPLPADAAVLGDNKLHRMALGALCWVGFSLATLLPATRELQAQVTRAFGDQGRMYHLLNFLNGRTYAHPSLCL